MSTKEGAEVSKLKFRYIAPTRTPKLVKIEINKVETTPATPMTHVEHVLESSWWHGSARIKAFQMPELVATKIRALYERRKGRDIYNLWLAINELAVDSRCHHRIMILAAVPMSSGTGRTRPSAAEATRSPPSFAIDGDSRIRSPHHDEIRGRDWQ